MEVTETYSFRLVLEGKQVKRSKSSKLEFLEKFLVNNFALWDAKDNTCVLLKRGGVADLPLLRTLLAICQQTLASGRTARLQSFGKYPSRVVNHLSKVIWDKKFKAVHQVYQFHQNKLASCYMSIKISKDKHISRWNDRENLVNFRWNRVKNCT